MLLVASEHLPPTDKTAPEFGGLTSAVAVDARTVRLEWLPVLEPWVSYDVSYAEEPGAQFTIKRVVENPEVTPGMPVVFNLDGLQPGRSYWFCVRARDKAGNRDTNSVELGCVMPEDVAGRPVVAQSPSPGATIQPTTGVEVTVTDESARLRRVIVHVSLPKLGVVEVVHDGNGFTGLYSANSTREVVDGGWRFLVKRSGGWPCSPTFHVFAFDKDGNEAGD